MVLFNSLASRLTVYLQLKVHWHSHTAILADLVATLFKAYIPCLSMCQDVGPHTKGGLFLRNLKLAWCVLEDPKRLGTHLNGWWWRIVLAQFIENWAKLRPVRLLLKHRHLRVLVHNITTRVQCLVHVSWYLMLSSMADVTKSNAERIDLLRKACDHHQNLYRDSMRGRGIDRHLFCLYVLSKGFGYVSRPLSKTTTSCVPQPPPL